MGSTRNANGRDRKTVRQTTRRGRENPSRQRIEPVGQWDAEVKMKCIGPNRADMRRKVRTVGTVQIDVADLFEEAKQLLRQGYEVRLTSENDGEAIRLFPCLDANYSQMFVAAMSMGTFRTTVADIPFRMTHCGEEVDVKTASEEKAKKAETIRQNRQHVTPDTVVKCPNCGTEFRVGKTLG